MIYSVSEIGEMTDFLKAFPFISIEEYTWRLTVPQIELMKFDTTHIEHLSERQVKMRKGTHIGGEYGFDNVNDLGGNIF